MGSTWKTVGASAVGSSHVAREQPCQDRFLVDRWSAGTDAEVLIVACADGAGSASRSERGAEVACEEVVEAVRGSLDERGSALLDGDEESARRLAVGWYEEARDRVVAEAVVLGESPRQLASTLLLAVVGPRAALFAQLGDGAIVVGDPRAAAPAGGGEPAAAEFLPVIEPEAGEYINETSFLIENGYADRLRVAARPERVVELAMMTDGLQRLALDVATNAAHATFFRPMFRGLREGGPAALQGQLEEFLGSPRLAERTDDDTTLVLASRRDDREHG